MLTKYVYETNVPGPRLLLLGAVHGNETAGSKAIMHLKEALDSKETVLKCGSLTLLPVCNPLAYAQGVRFVEKNLNRIIRRFERPSCPEEEFADEVVQAILQNEYILDLHSTHNAGEPPFAFLDYPGEQTRRLVAAADVDYVICNWPKIYRDVPIADYCTEYFAHVSGRYAITLECGYHYDRAAEEIARKSIYNVLAELKMIDCPFVVRDKSYLTLKEVVIKKRAGHLQRNYRHLDAVAKGEVIGLYEDGEKVTADYDGFILIPNHDAADGTEWFYLAVK